MRQVHIRGLADRGAVAGSEELDAEQVQREGRPDVLLSQSLHVHVARGLGDGGEIKLDEVDLALLEGLHGVDF